MTFADWWKVNDVKEDQEEKNDSNITDLSCQAAHDVINEKNVFLCGIQGCMLPTLEMLFHYL